MIRNLKDQYQHEDQDLAPYATHNLQTKGRRFKEPPHPLRTDFQRDRDRILHSKAFRRLEYKSQVFLNGTGDHLRTRLTHTIEVAAISRTIARALYLNEDLTESIALAHDLGHPPFGHPGEVSLNELMKEHDGFDHNKQALRIIDYLEHKYPDFDGINLTWEVRSGLIKHRESKTYLDTIELPQLPSLESQVADLADDLTYYGHDVDDGLDSELITEDMIGKLKIWQLATAKAKSEGLSEKNEKFNAFTVRCLIDMMVANAVYNSNKNLVDHDPKSSEEAQNLSQRIISFDDEFNEMTQELRSFLYHNLYYHPEVANANNTAVKRMEKLFEICIEKPELMGKKNLKRIEHDGLHQTTADYISRMTDRFAIIEYERCCT